MNARKTLVYGCMWLAVLLGSAGFLHAKIKCNGQQIGIVTLRGHYRGWFASFRDGVAYKDGKFVPVVLSEDGQLVKYGYRIWPRFYHLNRPDWKEDKFAIGATL